MSFWKDHEDRMALAREKDIQVERLLSRTQSLIDSLKETVLELEERLSTDNVDDSNDEQRSEENRDT